MKKKSILGFFVGLLGFGLTATSCEDMLTPDMSRYSSGFSGKDTVAFYLGILGNMQEMIEQNILLGDLRSDLAETTTYTSDSISDIVNFKRTPDGENKLLNRSAYYKVINQCNFYLAKVDSMAAKNGVYYMRKEMAQVLLIRAWTYMQLVQNYGRVPFITEPVDNANTGWETNPPAWATPDNLIDLVRSDCEQALAYEKELGFPKYGTFETGNYTYAHSLMRFPANLVLGDLYLLRGASKSDYVAAAKYYYEYLNHEGSNDRNVTDNNYANYTKTVQTLGGNRIETFVPGFSSYALYYRSSSVADYGNETVTLLPSTSQSYFGRTLTRIPQIYGFDPSSTVTTTEGTNSAGETTYTQSGQISVKANYENRQIAPSPRFEALNTAQNYAYRDYTAYGGSVLGTDFDIVYVPGDARYYGTAPEVQTEAGRLRFVQKYCGTSTYTSGSMPATVNSFNFRYNLTIYRLHQVYLHFAEALNRAGYPRYAFAVLHGGLHRDRIPGLVITDTIFDDDAHTKQYVYDVLVDSSSTAVYENYFLTADEQMRASRDPNYAYMLNFTGTAWENEGLHDLGCGFASNKDSLNDYAYRVGQRILDEELRRNGQVSQEARRLVKRLRAADDTPGEGGYEGEGGGSDEVDELTKARWSYDVVEGAIPDADPLEIDAVESLIADEGALDMGYEGMRYYDLMRIARHKNNDTSGLFPANNGTNWFAWQIARRSKALKLYENPQEYDATIYGLLQDMSNWYLVNPEY